MPFPVAAALMAAGPILEGVTGGIVQGKMNKKTRQFAREMYDRQRADALTDWHMQNAYNDPSAQMARLAAAGLNPALIYGKGAGDMTSAPIRSSNAPSWNPKAPELGRIAQGATNGLLAYHDMRIKKAQEDNLTKTNEVLTEDKNLRMAQTLKTLADTKGVEFDVMMKNLLKENSLEVAKATLDKTKTETSVMSNRDEREALMTSSNLREAAERILTARVGRDEARARIANMEKDGLIKQFEIELNKAGLTKSDPRYWRVAEKGLQWILNNSASSSEAWKGTMLESSDFENKVRDFIKGIFR